MTTSNSLTIVPALLEEHRAMLNESLVGLHAPITLFAAYRGSIAHGMFVPSTDPDAIDDVDFMAVVVPPLKHYFGLDAWPLERMMAGTPYAGSHGTCEYKVGATDLVAYEIRKFIALLKAGNPNVLTMLWLPPKHIFMQAPEWNILRYNRDRFVGKHVFSAFKGYAYAQFEHMERGHGSSQRGYNGAKRKELRTRFGYDCKNAAHMIRLLRMGIEFLRDGTLYVDRAARGDADELLAIKRGEWTLAAVKREALRLFQELDAAMEESVLPAGPQHETIDMLCVSMVRSALRSRGEV